MYSKYISMSSTLPYSMVHWRLTKATEISCKDWMSWKHSTTIMNAASLCTSWVWTFVTTLLVWGAVALSKKISNTLFCTLSIIGLHAAVVAGYPVIIAAVSLCGCSATELSWLRCAQFPVLLRKLEAGGVWLLRAGTSGGYFLCPLSYFLACWMDILTFVPLAMGVTSTFVRQPGMISCKPPMTLGLHCIEVLCKASMDVLVKMSWMIASFERESTIWNSWMK